MVIGILGGVAFLGGCSQEIGSQSVVRVPGDVATLQEAADLVAPDGLILVGSGTFRESLELHTEGVTVRGADRNLSVIDGEGMRTNGIVATGAGITIENLTVINHLLNGVLVTGMTDKDGHGIGSGSNGYNRLDPEEFPAVPGYAVRNVTVSGNGLYGIYAFNRTNGLIENNYASGSADSGIYVGQCRDCQTVVRGNVAELNAIGLEMANASGTYVISNRFSNNRIGASIQSNYQEALVPQTNAYVVGNVFDQNVAQDTPEAAEGGFGIGVGFAGVQDSVFARNVVTGNASFGLGVTSSQDVSSQGNKVAENVFADNAVDVAAWSTSQADLGPNCIEVSADSKTFPEPFPQALTCQGDARIEQLEVPRGVTSPAGISFLEVSKPTSQPSLTFAELESGFGRFEGVDVPDIDVIGVPTPDLLKEFSQR